MQYCVLLIGVGGSERGWCGVEGAQLIQNDMVSNVRIVIGTYSIAFSIHLIELDVVMVGVGEKCMGYRRPRAPASHQPNYGYLVTPQLRLLFL